MTYIRGERIGRGSLELYQALDREGGTVVATICKLPREVTQDDGNWASFNAQVEEWKNASRHAYVVTILEVDLKHERPRLILERIDPITLRERIRTNPLPLREAERILRNLLEGLNSIHKHNLAHRDIRPEYIYQCGGVFKLFPKAWFIRSEKNRYTSPELWFSNQEGSLADIYSLGIVAYEMLLGSERFRRIANAHIQRSLGGSFTPGQDDREDPEIWHRWHTKAASLPVPHRVEPQLPEDFSRFVLKMIVPKASQRLQSCQEALEELDRVDPAKWPTEAARSSTASSSYPQAPPFFKRLWVRIGIGCVAALALVLALMAILIEPRQDFTISTSEPTVGIYSSNDFAKKPFSRTSEESATGSFTANIKARPGTEVWLWKKGLEALRIELQAGKPAVAPVLKIDSGYRSKIEGDIRKGHVESAITALFELRELVPSNQEAAITLASLLYQQTRFRDSLDVLSEENESFEDQGTVHFLRALNMLSLPDPEIDSVRNSFALAREYGGPAEAVFYLGLISFELSQHEEAAQLFREYISLSPSAPELDLARQLVEQLSPPSDQAESGAG